MTAAFGRCGEKRIRRALRRLHSFFGTAAVNVDEGRSPATALLKSGNLRVSDRLAPHTEERVGLYSPDCVELHFFWNMRPRIRRMTPERCPRVRLRREENALSDGTVQC